MKLTRIIFDKWAIWMTIPDKTIAWSLKADKEALGFYDGHHMNFFYALNHEWYLFNNKKYAHTGCNEPYEEPMDFYIYDDLWK
jgi:hypothetical protein